MNSRSFVSGFLVLTIAFFVLTGVNARADSTDLAILSPAAPQSYQPGDTIKVEWSSGLSPSSRQPMIVELLGQKFKRYRIGSVTKKQNDGLYSVTWKIPENFFEMHKIVSDSPDFKIVIRQGNDLRNRFVGRDNLIKIQKNAPAQPAPNGKGTSGNAIPNPSQISATLSSRSQLVASYEFKSLYEPWVVSRLTVVNDSNNDGFDPNPSETTDAVDKVYVRYPDGSGALQTSSAPYINGKATFSGLDFYIPRGSANLDLFVDTVDPKTNGGKSSGKPFRMGIQDSANDASTFEAVGQISSTTINTLDSFQVSRSSSGESVVRTSVLDFAVTDNGPLGLSNGDSSLFDFTVSAASASLGRLVFDVNQTGLTSLDGAKLYRNGRPLEAGDSSQSGEVYLMWDSGPSSCFAQFPQVGAGTGMNCNGGTSSSAKLIVAFTNEEVISGTVAYKLSFNVGGASAGDRIVVQLDSNDDFAQPVIPGTDSLNAKIYNGGSAPELFANPTDFASEATSITNRNVIWSDVSADIHRYPGISPAALPATNSGSSADWTNGYLLGLNALPAVTSEFR
jgi:hypothetical protein